MGNQSWGRPNILLDNTQRVLYDTHMKSKLEAVAPPSRSAGKSLNDNDRRVVPAAKPFSPESLAARWECSSEKVRQMFHAGELAGFRLGKLIRIPALEIERFECSLQQLDHNMSSSPTAANSLSLLAAERIVAESRLARMMPA